MWWGPKSLCERQRTVGREGVTEIASDVENGIAVIRLMRPGEGSLTPKVRSNLMRALAYTADTDTIDGVVLSGTGATFSSGLDLREYDQSPSGPTLRDLAETIETHPKPVVAALNGSAFEAGFEIALAAHARVARVGVKVALPQVSLGMVPSGGASQRLPRLTGARTALELLLSGRAVSVEDSRLTGLFEQITTELPLREAQSLARKMADSGTWTKSCDTTTGLSDPVAFETAVRASYDKLKSSRSVEFDIIRAVEAALLLPFEQGLDLEETASEERRLSSASRARRHLFSADHMLSRDVAQLQAKARPIRVVAVMAGHARVVALATASLDISEELILFAHEIDAAEQLATAIDTVLADRVKKGVLSAAARDEMIDRISLSDDPEILKEAELVFDSGPIWDGPIGTAPGAVWCVLDERVSTVEQARRTGSETLAINTYRPAHAASLIEIMSCEDVREETAATVAHFFSRMGRTVMLHSKAIPSLGERISAPLYMAALVLARHGVDPQALEDGARELGFPRGVLDMIDREGAGRVLSRLSRLLPDIDGRDWLGERVTFMDRNWPGAGAIYSSGTEGSTVDPDLSEWLAGWRQKAGVLADVPDVPVAGALHAAVVNSLASMQRLGQIQGPEHADLCVVRGFGVARDRGGLLFQADQRGLLPLLRTMKALSTMSPLWAPDPLVVDMIKQGKTFFGQAVATQS